MRNNVFVAAAIVAAVVASSTAFAGEKTLKHSVVFNYAAPTSGYEKPQTFKVVRPGDLSKGQSAFIKAHANPAEAKALIDSDRALAAELRAHGVQLKNVIDVQKAGNGRLIVYIK